MKFLRQPVGLAILLCLLLPPAALAQSVSVSINAGTTVILSGQSGADAHHYQEKDVQRAIAATKESKP